MAIENTTEGFLVVSLSRLQGKKNHKVEKGRQGQKSIFGRGNNTQKGRSGQQMGQLVNLARANLGEAEEKRTKRKA